MAHIGPQVPQRRGGERRSAATAADPQDTLQAQLAELRKDIAAKEEALSEERDQNAQLKAALTTAEDKIKAQAQVIASIKAAFKTSTSSMQSVLAKVGCWCWCCRCPASAGSICCRCHHGGWACMHAAASAAGSQQAVGTWMERPRRPPAGPGCR